MPDGSSLSIGHLLSSFIVGALCVSAFSVTADRYGSRISGVLASFPATLAASLFLTGLSGSPELAAEAAISVPALSGFLGIFLCTYCALLGRGFGTALGISLLIWLALSCSLAMVWRPPIPWSVAILVASASITYWVLEIRLRIPSRGGAPVALNGWQAMTRMLLGGGLVSGSIALAHSVGPTFGAVLATFPAVTVATLAVTYQSGGGTLSAAFAKSLAMSAMINSGMLAVAVAALYPRVGLYTGSGLALLLVLVSSFLSWLLVRRMV